MKPPMTLENFKQLAGTYGANPQRWPEKLAQPGQDFMAKYPEQSAQILATEALLDNALDENIAPPPSDLLRSRILNGAAKPAANDHIPVRKPGLLHWRSAAALVIGAFALGFGGANIMPSQQDDPDTFYAEADTEWQSAADDLGVLDTFAWVEGVNNS